MIRQLSQCPYCRACEIALDDSPELLFNPEASAHAPCAHLVWVEGRYEQWQATPQGLPQPIGSIEFHWEHPGLGSTEEASNLSDFMRELINHGKTWDFAPAEPFEISPIAADQKATGPRGKTYTAWEVDGQAVFAQDASAFVAALPACMDQQNSTWKSLPGSS
jgi:hypothetical protein